MTDSPPIRVLVLGATGMLGNAMLRLFAGSPGYIAQGSGRSAAGLRLLPEHLRPNVLIGVDVENPDALTRLLGQVRPPKPAARCGTGLPMR